MFDQIKDLYKLKKQAEELQKQMANERITGTYGSVSVTINGNQELVEVTSSGSEPVMPSVLTEEFRKAFNQAQSDMKKVIAQKFRGMM